ncbi:hypothetical protein [Pleomorphomonas koreensis]|jgi:hypothetical protein|uniref:hypothetical protein n=1 Tax=Pleomorphomonas koreensis TaxID=257440 RepID=UPI0003F9A702|nr:hypothetical protein [Pleomorphomonas koreensis]
MSFEQLQTGVVLRYANLWTRQTKAGETDGRKDRPVAVGVRIARKSGDLILFFPVTSKEPEASRFAAEIPPIEKRRAGLDADIRLWLILDEYNTDIVGQSFYLEPAPPLGSFSKAFFLPLLRAFVARRKTTTEINKFR